MHKWAVPISYWSGWEAKVRVAVMIMYAMHSIQVRFFCQEHVEECIGLIEELSHCLSLRPCSPERVQARVSSQHLRFSAAEIMEFFNERLLD